LPEIAVTIVNPKGLHARAAARFVRTAEAFTATVTVSRDEVSAVGTSILGLMMLAAGCGTVIRLAAVASLPSAALDALADLVRRGFDET
jgi:phosphocarrier protein